MNQRRARADAQLRGEVERALESARRRTSLPEAGLDLTERADGSRDLKTIADLIELLHGVPEQAARALEVALAEQELPAQGPAVDDVSVVVEVEAQLLGAGDVEPRRLDVADVELEPTEVSELPRLHQPNDAGQD